MNNTNTNTNRISMETIERSNSVEQHQQQQQQPQQQQQQQQEPINRGTDVAVTDENTALNVMVSYLHLAHKRGAFNIQESAKIWECIQIFTRPQ